MYGFSIFGEKQKDKTLNKNSKRYLLHKKVREKMNKIAIKPQKV